MNRPKTAVILLLLSIASFFPEPGAHAEKLELLSFDYELVPEPDLEHTSTEEEELRIVAHTYSLKFALPVLLDGTSTAVLNSFTLRTLHQVYHNVEAAGLVYTPDDLYTFKYGLVFLQKLSPQWRLAVLVQPSLLSDLVDVDRHHIRLRAGFMFTRTVSERFSYSIGGGYSDDYGEEKVLPVVQLKWTDRQHWDLMVDLPQKFSIWYLLSDRWRTGIQAKVTGAHFRIGHNINLERGSTGGGRVKYSILNIGPSLRYNLYKGVNLTFNTGTSIYRKFEVFDRDGNLIEDPNAEQSLFFKVGIDYNVGG